MIGIGYSSNLRYNLKQWLERRLLNNGMYTHALISDIDYYGNENAILSKNGDVFESAANEWVHEEDVTVPAGFVAPISVSGVYINSVYHANDSSPYKPSPDYVNGRFTFKGTVPGASDVVKANFTHRDITVDFPDSDNYNMLMSDFLDNPDYSTGDIYPSGATKVMPLIIIDPQTREHTGRQLGGGKVVKDRVNFWVFAARDWERDAIMDILFDSARETVSATDYNDVPEILDFYGAKSATYKTYTELGTDHPWTRIYLDKMSIRNKDLIIKLYKGRVEGLLTIYQNP